MDYLTIRMEFDFVSGAPPFARSAVVNRVTGDVYYASELGDADEIPEELNDDYVDIPHKNDLDLGREMVMEFVYDRCANDADHVRAIFQHRGTYARFKGFLAERNLLDAWHSFQDKRTDAALM